MPWVETPSYLAGFTVGNTQSPGSSFLVPRIWCAYNRRCSASPLKTPFSSRIGFPVFSRLLLLFVSPVPWTTSVHSGRHLSPFLTLLCCTWLLVLTKNIRSPDRICLGSPLSLPSLSQGRFQIDQLKLQFTSVYTFLSTYKSSPLPLPSIAFVSFT